VEHTGSSGRKGVRFAPFSPTGPTELRSAFLLTIHRSMQCPHHDVRNTANEPPDRLSSTKGPHERLFTPMRRKPACVTGALATDRILADREPPLPPSLQTAQEGAYARLLAEQAAQWRRLLTLHAAALDALRSGDPPSPPPLPSPRDETSTGVKAGCFESPILCVARPTALIQAAIPAAIRFRAIQKKAKPQVAIAPAQPTRHLLTHGTAS